MSTLNYDLALGVLYMLLKLLVIGAGGFLGAIVRYVLSNYVQEASKPKFSPMALWLFNLLGCLLIGIIMGFVINYQLLGERVRLFIIMGFLGSLTTFSTFGYETLTLIKDNEILLALANVVLQVAIGIFVVWLGYVCSKLIMFGIGFIGTKIFT